MAESPWSLAAVGLATATLLLAYRFLVYPMVFSPLADIPNAHWSSAVSSLWILWVRFQRRENRVLYEAHRRLGPVVRVGPADVSVDGADLVRTVYGGGFEKTDWYAVFDNYGVPCMFSTGPAREHSLRKRMVSHVYSKSYLQSSDAAKAQARHILFGRLLPLLRASAAPSQEPHGLNVLSLFLAATMDFVSAYVFGLRDGTDFLRRAAYREHWLELYLSRHNYPFFPQELPRLTRFLRGVLGVSPYPRWVDAANRELAEWNRRHCDAALRSIASGESGGGGGGRRRENPADEPVVLGALLAGLRKEEVMAGADSPLYKTAILQRELTIYSEVFDHVLAGQETAGVALTYLAWHLSRRPEVQRRLQEELLSLSPNMRVSTPIEEDEDGGDDDDEEEDFPPLPDAKALDALPLLHAVVTETLRLHAPIPGPLPRRTPSPSCRLAGYVVPGGVRVAALAYTLHRDERLFPQPEEWEPARWLHGDGEGKEGQEEEEEEEELRKERARQFWAFSSGGRMCIGSNFAMNEMKLITALIYSNFTSHIVDDEGMEQTDGYTARPTSERLYLRFEPLK